MSDALSSRNAFDVLSERGFVQDATEPDVLRDLLGKERVTFYVGFDPTSSSLHIGNLVGMMAMAWLQRCGHRPIALAGGGTGRIGDPSFRDDERDLLDDSTITSNLTSISEQLGRLLVLDTPDDGLVLDNHDWLGRMGSSWDRRLLRLRDSQSTRESALDRVRHRPARAPEICPTSRRSHHVHRGRDQLGLWTCVHR